MLLCAYFSFFDLLSFHLFNIQIQIITPMEYVWYNSIIVVTLKGPLESNARYPPMMLLCKHLWPCMKLLHIKCVKLRTQEMSLGILVLFNLSLSNVGIMDKEYVKEKKIMVNTCHFKIVSHWLGCYMRSLQLFKKRKSSLLPIKSQWIEMLVNDIMRLLVSVWDFNSSLRFWRQQVGKEMTLRIWQHLS